MKNRKTAKYYYELWTQKHGKTEHMNTLNIYNNNIFKNSLIIKLLEHCETTQKNISGKTGWTDFGLQECQEIWNKDIQS